MKLWNIITFKSWNPTIKWIVLVLVFSCSLTTLFVSFASARDLLRLMGEGVEIDGKIINKYTQERRDDDGDVITDYFITYEFDAKLGDPPAFMTDTSSVTQAAYNRYETGQSIPVTFLYDNPQVNSINPQADYEGAAFGLACVGIWLVILFIIFAINVAVGLRRATLEKGI